MVNTSSHAALCYSDARGAGGNSSRRSAPTLDHLWAMGSQVRLYDRSGFGGNDINTALLTSSPFSGLYKLIPQKKIHSLTDPAMRIPCRNERPEKGYDRVGASRRHVPCVVLLTRSLSSDLMVP
ncbi:hypothetical protein GEV33_006300 [Tenebrio molitor]|uniref:Uncharacterized protein n=1 Tax=Tenebrio molitor TaxID=7067 RepID=A0A8J6HCW8_TENMO|nr:hypothetical protein GEV33_006300 [Tenebrio molitor]